MRGNTTRPLSEKRRYEVIREWPVRLEAMPSDRHRGDDINHGLVLNRLLDAPQCDERCGKRPDQTYREYTGTHG